MTKMWEKQLEKKKNFKKGPASLLKFFLWASFQFVLVQIWFLGKQPQMGYSKQLMI